MHTTPNGKRYVGVTIFKNVNRRWQNGTGYKTQLFGRAVDKYGWNNIVHEVLITDMTKAEAEAWEKETIALYRSDERAHGYNILSGGDASLGIKKPVICIETGVEYESCGQAAEAFGGKQGNLSTHLTRNNNERLKSFKGFHFAYKQELLDSGLPKQEFLASKIAIIEHRKATPFKHTPATTEKLRQLNIGKKASPETREKMSQARLGKKRPPEWTEKVRRSNMKPVICIETGLEYESVNAAGAAHGGHAADLTNHLKGKQYHKTFKGFHFTYA